MRITLTFNQKHKKEATCTQFSGEEMFENCFMKKKFNSLTDKCPSNKLAIVNMNFAQEIDYSVDLLYTSIKNRNTSKHSR